MARFEGTEVLELSPGESIQILEKTKEILGPNGEHWTKHCWVAVERTDEDGDWYTEDITWEMSDEAADVSYCIMGAIEQAAFELGISKRRLDTDRFATPISLEKLVKSRAEWETWSVIDVNDKAETTFETIRELIDTRLSQLRELD